MNPNVLRSDSKLSGEAPNTAVAMDGSTKQRFSPVRIAVFERIAGAMALYAMWQDSPLCGQGIAFL